MSHNYKLDLDFITVIITLKIITGQRISSNTWFYYECFVFTSMNPQNRKTAEVATHVHYQFQPQEGARWTWMKGSPVTAVSLTSSQTDKVPATVVGISQNQQNIQCKEEKD